ncbi:MAG: hypothetical protein ACYC0V_13680 [Armatimonadota bacterium]
MRIQFQLDDETYCILKDIAHNRGTSMSAVVRGILHDHLVVSPKMETGSIEAFTFVSSGTSRYSDISECHDEALAEDFK